MPNYENAKIYKLVNDSMPDKIYFGSTIQKYLSARLASHKHKKCCKSKELFEYGEVKIILVEKVNCKDKDELLKRERYYIENFNCINKYLPLRTKKEWRDENREYCITLTKAWNDKNKKVRQEKITCVCGKTISRAAHLRHIKKSQFHKDYINAIIF